MQRQRPECASRLLQNLPLDHGAIERHLRRRALEPLDRRHRLETHEPVGVLEADTTTFIDFCVGISASVDGTWRRTQMSSSGSLRK